MRGIVQDVLFVGARASLLIAGVLLVAGAFVHGGEARAGMIMQAYSHGQMNGAVGASDALTGYRFETTEDIFVQRLGVSIPFPDIAQPDIEITLWAEGDQSMIASAIVPGGDALPIEGGSRFVDIDTVRLDAGEGYRIAMYIPAGASGLYNLNDARTESPFIEFGARYFRPNAGGSSFPMTNPQPDITVSGPNFQFVLIPTPGAATLAFVASIMFAPRRGRAHGG
ncbi:MAG: hypothetical protein EA379_12425 [Phycisphaerales bacterium]|nr:MAG: hypothetical protein EA379_12425 [Phycisphaerales bacterium]